MDVSRGQFIICSKYLYQNEKNHTPEMLFSSIIAFVFVEISLCRDYEGVVMAWFCYMRWIPWWDCCHSLRVLVPSMGKWPWLRCKHAIKPCVWLSEVLLFCFICELLSKGQSEIAEVIRLERTESVIQQDRGTWGEGRGWPLMCYLDILFCVKINSGDPGMA